MNIQISRITRKFVMALLCLAAFEASFPTVNAQCKSVSAQQKRKLTKLSVDAYRIFLERNYREAIKLSLKQLELARAACDEHREIDALTQLAESYFSLGEYHESLKYFNMSLSLARKIESLVVETVSLYRLSYCYIKLGDKNQAQEFVNQLEQLIGRVETTEPSYNKGYADIIRGYIKELQNAMKGVALWSKPRSNNGMHPTRISAAPIENLSLAQSRAGG